jgi:probable HAF family extracellular repeat protein
MSTRGRRLAYGVVAVATACLLSTPAVAAVPSTHFGRSTDLSVGFVLDRGGIDRIDLPGDGSFTTLGKTTNRGKIVGKAPYRNGVGYYGFVLDRDGGFRRIEFPGATTTYAQGINERGWIVGDASPGPTVLDPGATGFLLVRGKFTRIAYPGAVYTQAHGVNNRGQVVGEYLDKHGVVHGYRWERGRFTTFNGPLGTGASITDINDRGVMVGAYAVDPDAGLADLRGFQLRNGRYTTFKPLRQQPTLPFDINNRGQIVGTTSDPDLTTFHGFQLTKNAAGPVTQIDVPGSPNTSVFGIDDRGRIIGVYENPNATPTALRIPAAAMPLGLTSQKSR